MSNMSYCQFQNTLGDLQDCYETLNEKSLDELSDEERKAAKQLIQLCDRIAGDYMDEIE